MRGWRKRRDHGFAQRRMSDYLDGELTEHQRRRVRHHAAECPECGPTLRGLLRIRLVLRSPGPPRPRNGTVVPLVLDAVRAEAPAVERPDGEDGVA
jgi:anti-sigma factor RsiW